MSKTFYKTILILLTIALVFQCLLCDNYKETNDRLQSALVECMGFKEIHK